MILTPTILLAALAIVNIISFFLVYLDKQKSIAGAQRVPEVSFFVWAVFFSALGVLTGMFVWRHKTRKLNFVFGIGLLLIQQAALAYYILMNL